MRKNAKAMTDAQKPFDLNRMQGTGLEQLYQEWLSVANWALDLADHSGKHRSRYDVGYVADTRFNAYAMCSNEIHSIRVCVAVPLLLQYICQMTLPPSIIDVCKAPSSRSTTILDVCRQFGTPTEPYVPMELSKKVLDANSFIEFLAPSFSEKHVAFARAVAGLATIYCSLHEAAHIICGHTGYAFAKFGPTLLTEIDDPRMGGRKADLDLQRAWEFEADRIAARLICAYLFGPGRQRYVHYLDFPDADWTDAHLLLVCCFSIQLLFWVMGYHSLRFRSRSPHPHPFMRGQHVTTTIGALAPNIGISIESLLDSYKYGGILDAERVSSDVIRCLGPYGLISASLVQEREEYGSWHPYMASELENVLNSLNRLRPLYEEHAWISVKDREALELWAAASRPEILELREAAITEAEIEWSLRDYDGDDPFGTVGP